MVSVEDLVAVLNSEITGAFLEAALELYRDGDAPIDPENPDMEKVLDNIAALLNEHIDGLPLDDDL